MPSYPPQRTRAVGTGRRDRPITIEDSDSANEAVWPTTPINRTATGLPTPTTNRSVRFNPVIRQSSVDSDFSDSSDIPDINLWKAPSKPAARSSTWSSPTTERRGNRSSGEQTTVPRRVSSSAAQQNVVNRARRTHAWSDLSQRQGYPTLPRFNAANVISSPSTLGPLSSPVGRQINNAGPAVANPARTRETARQYVFLSVPRWARIVMAVQLLIICTQFSLIDDTWVSHPFFSRSLMQCLVGIVALCANFVFFFLMIEFAFMFDTWRRG